MARVTCPACGALTDISKWKCKRCKKELLIEMLASLDQKHQMIYLSESQGLRKSTGVAYVLLFFLGLLGAHKFYTGQILAGLMYFGWWVMSMVVILFAPVVGLILLFLLALSCFIELFTLPGECRKIEEEAKREMLDFLLKRQRSAV